MNSLGLLYYSSAFVLTLLFGIIAYFFQRMIADNDRRIQSLENTAHIIATELATISEKLGNLIDSLKAVEMDKRQILKEMADIKDEMAKQAVDIATIKAHRAQN